MNRMLTVLSSKPWLLVAAVGLLMTPFMAATSYARQVPVKISYTGSLVPVPVDPQSPGQFLTSGLRLLQLHELVEGSTLNDGPLEQAPGQGRGHQVDDRIAAGRLAEDRHALRITPKGLDVLLHPLQGLDLIEERVDPG